MGWGWEGSRAVFAVEGGRTGLRDPQGLAGQGAGSRPERVRASGRPPPTVAGGQREAGAWDLEGGHSKKDGRVGSVARNHQSLLRREVT